MKYIDMPDVETARRQKWLNGVSLYRKSADTPFVGDALEELFEELLDAISYADEAEKQYPAANFSIMKGMLRQSAEHIKRIRAKAK
jgi:hypothetical protein